MTWESPCSSASACPPAPREWHTRSGSPTTTGIERVAVQAEELGYDSVLVNDHMSTMPYVRAGFAEPPRFYEPIVTLSYLAARTSRIRMMTGVVVLPMRDPVLLAKQVATLDQISGGRLTLGVGVGAYRAEFESVRPDSKDAPGPISWRRASSACGCCSTSGRRPSKASYVAFDDVEMYPKPVQTPFPLYSCGNAPGTHAAGGARLCAGLDAGRPAGRPAGRRGGHSSAALTPWSTDGTRSALAIAPQMVMCLDRESGRRRPSGSPRRRCTSTWSSLRNTTLRDIDIDAYMSENLIGRPEQVVEPNPADGRRRRRPTWPG